MLRYLRESTQGEKTKTLGWRVVKEMFILIVIVAVVNTYARSYQVVLLKYMWFIVPNFTSKKVKQMERMERS